MRNILIYRPTILNISTAIFILWIFVDTILNFKILSANEGWGIVAMIALFGVALVAGLVDLILQKFIKNKVVLNILGLIIVIGLAIAVITG